jgi:TonB family protein
LIFPGAFLIRVDCHVGNTFCQRALCYFEKGFFQNDNHSAQNGCITSGNAVSKGLAISIAGHAAVLSAVAFLGTMQPAPAKRGYPTLMMATLIQKPVMAQSSAPLASQPVLEARPAPQLPAPELKPVPSTKLGSTSSPQVGSKIEAPKKAPEKKSPPVTKPTPTATTGRSGGQKSSVGTGIKLDAPEFPYPHYLVLIQFRIEGNWQPPFSGIGEEITTVYFKIGRDGEIQDEKIEKSSGNFALDQAALRAVRSSNPLPPLPSGSGMETLGVHFDFVAN